MSDIDEKHLVENQHIQLSIKAGDVKKDCHRVAWNSNDKTMCGDIDNYSIDLGSEIESTTLFVTSNIANNNTNSDFASITYTISGGGVESKDFPKTKEFNGKSSVAIKARFTFEQINSNRI